MAAPPVVKQALPQVEALPPDAWPNVDDLVTEDDTPVDNIFSEKQQRLLTEPLYSAWQKHPFLVLANVGLFYAVRLPPLVPDVMLSLDVQAPEDLWAKRNRSYFIWEYGKPPEVVIEIVSNPEGGEASHKMREYARIGVSYYVIFDPDQVLSREVVQAFELSPRREYVRMQALRFPGVDLGLTLWRGVYEGHEAEWLRWCDLDGTLIPTGVELAEQERQRAELEHQRAEQERQRAERERQRAERLAAQLRALGAEPENS